MINNSFNANLLLQKLLKSHFFLLLDFGCGKTIKMTSGQFYPCQALRVKMTHCYLLFKYRYESVDTHPK
ncbi:hypothetical protein GCM10025791_35690 [Halioxenophilus aromaticivorans]|uniref:Uncharacterized protein n=1 Tax=Halioxenophilus aromaticivorans TaxID=1306992 RepID=A0AAV3U664_9ALTE